MSGVTHHVFRRGLDVASQHMAAPAGDDQPQDPTQNVPIWGILLMVVTVATFALALSAIGYTYGMVVATLAAVEDPNAEFYLSLDPQGADPRKPAAVEPSLLPAKPKPITSSFRTTTRHLKERAGRWSRFRGLAAFLVFAFLRDMMVSGLTFGAAYEPTIGHALAQVFAEVLLADLAMAWVHIVISEPSPKRWYQRIPSFRTYRKILPAALVASLGSRVTFFVPMILGSSLSVDGAHDAEESPFVVLAVAALGIALTVLIEVPAMVTFIRVAASMLPEENEAIVPFDRTFGGKVNPAVVGGSGKIGLLDAWKSFDWASRIRFIMVSVKAMAMQIGLVFLFVIVFFGEIALVTGSFSPDKLRGFLGRSDL